MKFILFNIIFVIFNFLNMSDDKCFNKFNEKIYFFLVGIYIKMDIFLNMYNLCFNKLVNNV